MLAAKKLAVTILLLAAGGSARAWCAPRGLPFVPNRGQGHPEVAFDARTLTGAVFVTRGGDLVHLVRGPAGAWALSESFVDGNAVPSGGAPAGTRVSYFLPASAAEGPLPTYETLRFPEVWEGIDLSLAWTEGVVEKIFTVVPGASTDAIRIRVRGVENLRLGEDGALVATTGLGEMSFSRPVAYQIAGGSRDAVEVEYALFGSEYGFRIGAYDAARPLVVDPVLQSTYLGGTGLESFAGIALHSISGGVYVTGTTLSSNFPGVAGGAQPAPASGNNEVFVALLDPTLRTLIQATYFGGTGSEHPTGIAVSPNDGSVYVAGYTDSTALPGTAGAAQPLAAGLGDAFVARLSPSLTALIRATFFGGSFTDRAFELRLHPSTGEVYLAGDAISVDLPGRAGGAQPANNGSADAFLSRLDPTLSAILQSTYFGGGGGDQAWDIDFGSGGSEVFITGITSGGLPGTTGGAQPLFGGGSGDTDAFIARFSANLTTLGQATYLGASAFDNGYAVAVDPASGDVFAAGSTSSPNFPGVTGGARPTYGGGTEDAFLSRLSPSLAILRQSTFFGGSGGLENVLDIGIHPFGGVYVTGPTDSVDLPGTSGGAQPALGGFADAYLARFDPLLRVLHQATYLGGTRTDYAEAMAIGPAGGIYVAGTTESSDFPRTTGGAQPAFGSPPASGLSDAFASLLSPGLEGGPASPIPTLSAGAMAILATLLVVSALALLRLRGW